MEALPQALSYWLFTQSPLTCTKRGLNTRSCLQFTCVTHTVRSWNQIKLSLTSSGVRFHVQGREQTRSWRHYREITSLSDFSKENTTQNAQIRITHILDVINPLWWVYLSFAITEINTKSSNSILLHLENLACFQNFHRFSTFGQRWIMWFHHNMQTITCTW